MASVKFRVSEIGTRWRPQPDRLAAPQHSSSSPSVQTAAESPSDFAPAAPCDHTDFPIALVLELFAATWTLQLQGAALLTFTYSEEHMPLLVDVVREQLSPALLEFVDVREIDVINC